MMRGSVSAAFVCALFLLSSVPSMAQTPNPAMSAPDQLAWQFFIEVNTSAGGSNALFEAWAGDPDTFNPNPQFPTPAAPLALHARVVRGRGGIALRGGGRLLPAVPRGPGVFEEPRRNRESFDFIVQNNLFRI